MRKILTLLIALVMVIPVMAKGRNDGSTQPNAIDFSWDTATVHTGGTKWYVVDLTPLQEEEHPALNLFLANKDPRNSVTVKLTVKGVGNDESKTYTIGPKDQMSWSKDAGAALLLHQTEISLVIESNGPISMSARVFEYEDLDETCKDARPFSWTSGISQTPGVAIWYKVNIAAAKADATHDVCVVVTNNGSGTLTLHAGQSFECPTSGVTKRTIELAPNETLRDTIPHNMIANVGYSDLYVSLENDQPITVKAEYADIPAEVVLPAYSSNTYQDLHVPDTSLHRSDTLLLTAGETYYYRVSIEELNQYKKYEPEFTFLNPGQETVSIDRKMSFVVPANSAQGTKLVLDGGAEQIEVLKKNALLGLDADYIYVRIKADKDIRLISRFKHVREGKACATNIDFNWTSGHRQDAQTTQWYMVDLTQAKKDTMDILLSIQNLAASGSAQVDAELAYSCPSFDTQKVTRYVRSGNAFTHVIDYAAYSLLGDKVYVGLTTDKEIYFTATLQPAESNFTPEPDECGQAEIFDLKYGGKASANIVKWYKVAMKDTALIDKERHPKLFVQNLSETQRADITVTVIDTCTATHALSRSKSIAAKSNYTHDVAFDLLKNFSTDTIYVRVASTQDISFEIRLTDLPAGEVCASAIPFNWVAGNDIEANTSLWYAIDLKQAIKEKKDINVSISNKENKACKGTAWLMFNCKSSESPQTQTFSLAANQKRSRVIENSAFSEMVGADSALYIRVMANTKVHVEAQMLEPAPFDTIECPDADKLIPLVWNTLYTQEEDTVWYYISDEQLDVLRNSELTPEAYAKNLSGKSNTVKVEATFHCPITQKMVNISKTLGKNEAYTKLVARSTTDQYLRHDFIILRVTGHGKFEFKATLEDPNKGNDCLSAVRLSLETSFEQEARTTMWYRLNLTKMKEENPDLYGKSLVLTAKNHGANAKIKIGIYDDCAGNDILEGYGERSVAAGRGTTRSIPAYLLYGLASKDIYVRVESDQKLTFSSHLSDYKAQEPQDLKSIAVTAAPNVTYTVQPGITWYALCLPMLRNNYKFTDSTFLYVKNLADEDAKLTTAFTWQDTLTYAVPQRTRTIKANRTGRKSFKQLMDKVIKRAGMKYSIEGTDADYIDEMLRSYITDDSLTAYFMVKTEQPLEWRIDCEMQRGDACSKDGIINFDYEHGNVHPADSSLWYQVHLDSLIVPKDNDLRIYVSNWGNEDATVSADLYFDCRNTTPTKSETRILAVGDTSHIDIDRDLIGEQVLGWPELSILLSSNQAMYIWAELIEDKPREFDYDTVRAYICAGEEFTDTIKGDVYTVDSKMTWNDTVTWRSGLTMRDSVTTFYVYPIDLPQAFDSQDSLAKYGFMPLLAQGMQLFVDSSSIKLTEYYKNLGNTVDTIMHIDTVYWAKPRYRSNGTIDPRNVDPLDTTSFYGWNDSTTTLMLVIRGDQSECAYSTRTPILFTIADYMAVERNDTLCSPKQGKNPDTLACSEPVLYDTLGMMRKRNIDTIVTYFTQKLPVLLSADELEVIPYVENNAAIDDEGTIDKMLEQFEEAAEDLTMKITDAKWQVQVGADWQDITGYIVPADAETVVLRYVITTGCGNELPSEDIRYTLDPACQNDTVPMDKPVMACRSYHWDKNNTDYTESGTYYYDAVDEPVRAGVTCYKVYELNLVITGPVRGEALEVNACRSYTWDLTGETYTQTAIIHDTIETADGQCDSIVTLNLTIWDYEEGDTLAVEACKSYTWHGHTYTQTGLYQDTVTSVSGQVCGTIKYLDLTITEPKKTTIYDTTCEPYEWYGYTFKPGSELKEEEVSHTFELESGCDSIVTLHLTVYPVIEPTLLYDTACVSYIWDNTKTEYKGSTVVTDTLQSLITGCDSIVELHLTILQPVESNIAVTECNMYEWHGVTYYRDTVVSYTMENGAANGCDSVATLTLKINKPYQTSLPMVSKYGNKLLMINRIQINEMTGWNLDEKNDTALVKWYREAEPEDEFLGYGYYYTNKGKPVEDGIYYAKVEIPASDAMQCGAKGETNHYRVSGSGSNPALVPSLAQPGQDIRIIHLDPEQHTIIRIYNAQGVLRETYNVSGETAFTIKAARDNGFYIVELLDDSMKTTLRYIVK